jgi:diguanylate cyclase (GGDEF)-like protein/PAS domain S-box-containing protein
LRPDLGYEALRHLIDEVVFIHDVRRRVVFVSPSVENVLGYSEEAFTALSTIELIHPDDLPAAIETGMAVRDEEGASYRSVLRVRRADGSFVWCEIVGRNLLHTEVAGVINTLRDISERRALEERLFAQAFRDELTGLPNRRAFVHQLEEALKQHDEPALGVLIVDLDGFKAVNDRLGHLAGDELLSSAAGAVQGVVRAGDLAARLGGDEFAILCRDVREADDLLERSEAIRRAGPLGTGDPAVPAVTFSVGAALRIAGDAPTDLLRAADQALYRAKRGGRNRVALGERKAP